MSILYILLLGLAVSMDSFIAGATYGIRKIRLPFLSLLIVGGVTALCSGLAIVAAGLFGGLINAHIAIAVGSFLLLSIGLFSIFQEYLLQCAKGPDDQTNPRLSMRIGRIIINIMVDPEAVDFDHSKSISAGEAVMLGFALGLDNMAATFAASLLGVLPLYTPVVMGLLQMLLIAGGIYLGALVLPQSFSKRFPYLSGIILVLIGLFRLVK